MKPLSTALALALAATLWAPPAHSFCGFYVAAGDAKLFNRSSKVVLVRDGDRTVLTMANDFHGDPKQFAIVIPVPTVLAKGQIQVGEPALIDHLDAYSAPRLVEYFDEDPCRVAMMATGMSEGGSEGKGVKTSRLPCSWPELCVRTPGRGRIRARAVHCGQSVHEAVHERRSAADTLDSNDRQKVSISGSRQLRHADHLTTDQEAEGSSPSEIRDLRTQRPPGALQRGLFAATAHGDRRAPQCP